MPGLPGTSTQTRFAARKAPPQAPGITQRLQPCLYFPIFQPQTERSKKKKKQKTKPASSSAAICLHHGTGLQGLTGGEEKRRAQPLPAVSTEQGDARCSQPSVPRAPSLRVRGQHLWGGGFVCRVPSATLFSPQRFPG